MITVEVFDINDTIALCGDSYHEWIESDTFVNVTEMC